MDSSDLPEYYPNLCKHENLDQAFGVYVNLQLNLHGSQFNIKESAEYIVLI